MVPLRTLHHSGPDRISPGTMLELSNDANIPSENDTSMADFESAWMTDARKDTTPSRCRGTRPVAITEEQTYLACPTGSLSIQDIR